MLVAKRFTAFAILAFAIALMALYATGKMWLRSRHLTLDVELSEVHASFLKIAPKSLVRETRAVTPRKCPAQRPGRAEASQSKRERTVEPSPLAHLQFPAPAKRHTEFAPQPAHTPRLERSPEIVRGIVAETSLRIREMYRRELRVDPQLRGELRVRFLVEPLGRVREVQVLGGNLTGTEFADAVVQVLQHMVFPAQPGTEEIEAYRQTFVFRPKS